MIGMKRDARDHTRQHAELKRIIRDQAIDILFQPILDLRDAHIIGYEAFMRGPRDSVFETPSSIFEFSRQTGMSGELDIICQRAALRQARRLSAGDKLFLNALPASLLDPGFREGLLADLPSDFPIRREDIVLEITDRHSIVDVGAFESEVSGLKSQGFRMSIDDVGRASTSLESLAELQPDFIKVDMSLIRNIHNNLIKQDLLRSVCEVARGMDAQVIAEGIETREELDTVLRCGARYGQGYLFFRPSKDLPAERAGTALGAI
jgi:EAL domain-containing protein (putative c-di-GMP-specific phosphodiesterase class I)